MFDVAGPIFQWLNANPELAGLATFIISAAESVAIIGTIIPGSIMMPAIGVLVGAGVLPFWPILIWAILGAIVGDGISYWIGHYFKDRLHRVWPFKTHPYILARGEKFFDKYGGMSVFIGRFIGPVRALVPLIAGMLGVKPLRFIIANVISALLWAPIYMLPGFLLGAASLELPSELAGRLIMILFLAVLLTVLMVWLLKKIFKLIQDEINQFLNWIWNSLKKSRYFYLLTNVLRHHNSSITHGQLALAFYLVVTVIAFLYLASYIFYTGPHGITLNSFVFHIARGLRTPAADNYMLYITLLGDRHVLFPVMFGLFCFFMWQKRPYTAWHLFLLWVLISGGLWFFKKLIQSPRPWGVLSSGGDGFSFPSGHVGLACTFYLAMTLFLISISKITYRKPFYFLAGMLITAVALSRLYFGVHWLTDIIGACLIGTAVLMLVTLSYNRTAEKPIQSQGVILTLILTLALSYSVNFYYTANKLKHDYTMLEWPSHTTSLNSWWQQQGEYFPIYRVNRLGLSVNVFNVQWLANFSDIKTILLQNGWEIAPSRDWISVLYRISSVQSTEHIPIVSPLYQDKKPVLVLVKYVGNKLVILRFWSSQFLIAHTAMPLWLGSVEYAPSTYSWLFKRKRANEISPTPSLLFANLPHDYDIKESHEEIKAKNPNKAQSIILIKPKYLPLTAH